MLEVKNGRAERERRILFSNLSFIAREGEAVCVSAPPGGGKTLLLRSFLGFHPLDDGYVSVDGELITPASVSFFRKQMSYLPQDVDMPFHTVADMLEQLFALKKDVPFVETKASLMTLWKELGIQEETYSKAMENIIAPQRRLLMLTAICAVCHPIVLLDEPTTGMVGNELESIGHCIRLLTRNGASVIVTCQEHDPVVRYCDKLIELNTHPYS
ncbi:MAG: ATP-binding cassette domain-containing protein [Prevotella sp.]|nr:ATP-binding cassette domain-containing protein [Prevotella sp.]